MSHSSSSGSVDRRTFLTRAATIGGAALAAAYASQSFALGSAWRDQIGLQLFTVRDKTATDYPGTLMEVAHIGYKEVQTTGSYGEYTAAQIKSFLDRAGLVSPATHVSPTVGPDFERTLEGYQMIGHRYSTVNVGRAPATQTVDSVKRTAEQLNQAGMITKKYGIKVIIHNHTTEFAPIAGSTKLPYDILLAETDPPLVAMELDIGWATVAGQNALELFRKTPGRFEVWHVKDVTGLAALRAMATQEERQRGAKLVPVGDGEIDYKSIFAQAKLAGMKHFYVEQDSATQSGDSIAAAATSYRHLAKILA